MEVILDVDGVLANFNKRAVEALGYNYQEVKYKIDCWHWYKKFNRSFEELDSVCTVDFWEGVLWHSGGRDILTTLENAFGAENIYLCTTPMPNVGCGTGKMKWIKRHLPDYLRRYMICTAPKKLLATPDRLLVDDKNENVYEFIEAGGDAIMVPRPWNDNKSYEWDGTGYVIECIKHRQNKLSEV